MMPRKRNKENQGLPTRWRFTRNAYYYQVPPGQEHQWDGKQTFKLGKTLPEAYQVWAERMAVEGDIRTMAQIFERYMLEVVPNKAPKSQSENARQIKRLTAVFGHMLPNQITPKIVYQYVDKREAKTAAKRETEVLSHALTKAVQWGVIDKHPFKGEVLIEKASGPRDRYVEDWEVRELFTIKSKRRRGSIHTIHAYIKLKLLTGMARSDLLRLKPGVNFTDEGILIQRHKTAKKTGKRTLYEWNDDLREAVSEAKASRPVDLSPFLFCTRKGVGYFNEEKGTANGWDSLWGRFMTRVLKETKVTDRFTEHDLRAKCASDADSLEHARALLSHSSSSTTRIYRRKAERVTPGKGLK